MAEIAGRTREPAAPAEPEAEARRRPLPRWVITVASLVVFVTVWQFFGRFIDPVFGSYPTQIALAFLELAQSGKLTTALVESLQPFVVGYGCAILFGVPLGLVIGRFRLAEASLGIYVTAGYAMPLVALVPLLAGSNVPEHVPWVDVARAAAVIAVILIGGRFLLPPLFRAIGGAKTPEVFTTVALLIVAGTAWLATVAGLSPSLGAFMAGVLLSESEYRHELQADIEPFEGLLLGFFFISVGMSIDLPLARAQPGLLAAATGALLLAKAAIAFVLGRIAGQDTPNAVRFALALPQASEFSFVLFGAAVAVGAISAAGASLATLVTAASMVATPILFA
ncbi:MAG TPA: cation:proton antiporter, partial [Dongiaceae bacterium]